MLPVSKKIAAGVGIIASLMTAQAQAASVIRDLTVKSEGSRETVRLTWSEAGPYEVKQFATNREVVVILPEATLGSGVAAKLIPSDSTLIQRVRLQPVTLPNSKPSVQLTLTLNEWATVTADAGNDALELSFPVASKAAPAASPSAEPAGLEFTDERLKEWMARGGSPDTPSTGAGQAAAAALTDYYVPDKGDAGRRNDGLDAETNSVQSKLNIKVARVDFQRSPLENVLRLIAEQSEMNVILRPSDVAGKEVTLRLRNITLRQMLDAILKANGLGYTVEDGGIMRIVARDQVTSSAKEVRIEQIALNWVNAADVRDTLDPIFSGGSTRNNSGSGSSIEVSAASNSLIVRDVPENIQGIQRLINQIDVPEKQVLIQMRLVNMTEDARRSFGVRTDLASQSLERRFTERTGSIATGSTNNSTSTSGSSFSNSLTGGASSTSSNSNTATNGATNSSTGSSAFDLAPSSSAGIGGLPAGASALDIGNRFSAEVLGAQYDVDFRLAAQESRGEATTLSAPEVLSLNNQRAVVEVKRQIPYINRTVTDSGSFGSVSFVDVGTRVEVLPRITNNGFVVMSIQPEQILDTGRREFGTPVTDERNLTSSVLVKDEQTIALGGLREFDASNSEDGVPYLMRLPVLSWLFKNQSNTQRKTELYLFVTPRIIKDPNPTLYQRSLYDKIDYNWDLPDWYFDEVRPRNAPGGGTDPNRKS